MDPVLKEWLKDNVSDEMVKGLTPPFRFTKKTDDPQGVARISAGGNLETEQYLVYRGELPMVREILEKCLAVVTAKIIWEQKQLEEKEKEKNKSRIITNF